MEKDRKTKFQKNMARFLVRCPFVILCVFFCLVFGIIYLVTFKKELPKTAEKDSSKVSNGYYYNTVPSDETAPEKETGERETAKEKPKIQRIGNVNYMERPSRIPRCGYYDDPCLTPLTCEYGYREVSREDFSNVLFIGDSRVQGLSLFGDLGSASFVYSEGIMVSEILKKPVMLRENGRESEAMLIDLLKSRQYREIYIMIGINDLGYSIDAFEAYFESFITLVESLQPGVPLGLYGIMYISEDFDKQPEIYNNDSINARNCRIAAKTDGIKRIYLDMNEKVSDGNGNLKKEYTNDGCHLLAQYYSLWTEFILKHGL